MLHQSMQDRAFSDKLTRNYPIKNSEQGFPKKTRSPSRERVNPYKSLDKLNAPIKKTQLRTFSN